MNTATAPVEDNAMNPRPPYKVGWCAHRTSALNVMEIWSL